MSLIKNVVNRMTPSAWDHKIISLWGKETRDWVEKVIRDWDFGEVSIILETFLTLTWVL